MRGRTRAATARGARRVLQTVSAMGLAVLVTAVVLGATGWWLGWPELTVVAVGLAAALGVAALLTVGRSTYAVRLELSDRRVTVGARAVGRVEVRNTSRRRLLPAQVQLPVGHGSAAFALPSLGPEGSHEDVFAIPATRRSVVVVGPVTSVRGDPLGLVRRRLRWTDPVELYVHPPVVPLAGAAAGVLRDLEGEATRALSPSDMSFHALRDYEPGDDRRHIHWRTTARVGALMVRQFEDTRRTSTAVALSTATHDYADADELELAVAVAASLGVQAVRDQRRVTVLAGDGRLRTGTASALLDDLSALLADPSGRAGTELAAWVAQRAADASVALLVTGSVPRRADLRAAARHLPGVRTVVVVCRPGAEVEVTANGTVSVAQLGALADLPRVLRRVVPA